MYLKQGDFENAVKTLEDPKKPSSSPLTTISFVSPIGSMLQYVFTCSKDIQLEL